MQNNNETNDNVNKVVAEFFKKKPLQKSNYKRRPYPQHIQKNKSGDSHRNTSENDASKNNNSDAKDTKENNRSYNRHDRGYKKNNKRFGKGNRPHFDNKADSIKKSDTDNAVVNDETETVTNHNEPAAPAMNDTATVSANKHNEEIKAENEWYDPEVLVEIIGVRFKTGGKVYYFAPNGVVAQKNDNIIVETARGLEFGTVQTPNTNVKLREVVMPLKNALRIATDDDIKKHEENQNKVIEAMRICNEKIAAHNLDMKLVDVEYTFDNSKLLFYFTSDGRVDFRELVKDLAGVFKTRIELRQIGIREETKLLGGIGICGLPFCCKSFLTDFVQVSIKMAKEQGLSLNSAKISGACGRLMCCLRYEYDTYDEEIRRTPKIDTPVITPDGSGIVCETQPLAGLCKVKFTENDETVIRVYHRDDLKRAEHNEENN